MNKEERIKKLDELESLVKNLRRDFENELRPTPKRIGMTFLECLQLSKERDFIAVYVNRSRYNPALKIKLQYGLLRAWNQMEEYKVIPAFIRNQDENAGPHLLSVEDIIANDWMEV